MSLTARVRRALHWAALAGLLASAVGMQVAVDGAFTVFSPRNAVQWIRSPEAMRRLSLGWDALVADIYWIRAVQYYGGTKLSGNPDKSFDLLYPLLDITTTLDPRFSIAYRFGAILLSERHPIGPGRPDQAIALLEKGIRASPDRWEYYNDAGFVHYWWNGDRRTAAEWFLKGAALPDAPNWLGPLAATMMAEGGDREAARLLWTQLAETDQEWMRDTARIRLAQLDAEETIDGLLALVNRFYDETGRFPAGWGELVRAGLLPGVPLDPSGVPFTLDPVSGIVDVSPGSELHPLRRSGAPAAGA